MEDVVAKMKENGYIKLDYQTFTDIREKEASDICDMGYNGKKIFCIYHTDYYRDWSLDEPERLQSLYFLKEANVLPWPMISGENREYVFNQKGIDQELYRNSDFAVRK